MPRTNRRNLASWWHNIGSDDAIGSGPLSENIQAVYIADDLSYLQLPHNYALAGAGNGGLTAVTTAASNAIMELTCPAALEGLWILDFGVSAATLQSRAYAYLTVAVTAIVSDADALTVRQLGTLAPTATCRTGTRLNATQNAAPFVTGGPTSGVTTFRAWPSMLDVPRVWVPGGSIFQMIDTASDADVTYANALWLEVPRML